MVPSVGFFFTDTVRAAALPAVVDDSELVAAVVVLPPEPVSVLLLSSPQAAIRPPRMRTAAPVISSRRPTVVRMEVLLEGSLLAEQFDRHYGHRCKRDCLVSGDRAARRPPHGSVRGR